MMKSERQCIRHNGVLERSQLSLIEAPAPGLVLGNTTAKSGADSYGRSPGANRHRRVSTHPATVACLLRADSS